MRATTALATATLLALLAAPALATPELPQAQPAGAATLRFWGFPVYDAQLWVAPGFRQSTFASHPLALQLQYRMGFTAADTARRSLEEMARGGPIDPALAQRWQDQLERVLPDVKAGDRLLGVHRPGRGAEFFHNGKRIGEIADPVFAGRFFGIWLGPATSEPQLRESLLAGTPP
jgi:hypothetical protein